MSTTPIRIAVLGVATGPDAAAADMSEAGHEVRFRRPNRQAFAPVLETGRITLKDAQGRRDVAIARPTTEIGEAVARADLILAPVPASAQIDLARALAPHVADGQTIYLPPGTFGSYLMTKVMREAGNRADFAIAETGGRRPGDPQARPGRGGDHDPRHAIADRRLPVASRRPCPCGGLGGLSGVRSSRSRMRCPAH